MYTLDELIESLKLFDSDNDGRLTVLELKQAMTNYGVQLGGSEGGFSTKLNQE